MVWLERVEFDKDGMDLASWPWTIPALAAASALSFDAPVTFLVGENGTGKSTVLEAIAVACGCPEQGGTTNRWMKGPTQGDALAARTRPVLSAKPVGGGFFLRAESFFNVATAAEQAAYQGRPAFEAAQLLSAFDWRSPHARSHGEAFVGLFQGRMTGSSLWFMDEPEAALSFRSELILMAEMHNLVQLDAQFVVASHSPVLTAFPGASIYEFGDSIDRREWDELDLVQNSRAFLDDPAAFFRHLLD